MQERNNKIRLIRASFGSLLLTFISFPVWCQPLPAITLREYLEERFTEGAGKGRPSFLQVCNIAGDPLARLVFREYGAIFAAGDRVALPPRCIFKSEEELAVFQKSIRTKSAVIAGVTIELQEAAMNALLEAVGEMEPRRITPLDGAIAGRRNYADSVRIWNSRFIPALNYWVSKRKITRADADTVLTAPVPNQVARVVEWESQGFYFSTTRTRSIFSSVAPPGTSQHLSLLAFDVVEAGNPAVRSILNKHGWFQTIDTDEPHFTYLGIPETELPKRGLRRVYRGRHTFWIPLIEPSNAN